MTLLKIQPNKLRKLAAQYTQARVGLKRSGASLSTKELLKFNLDHALARDAIQKHWSVNTLHKKCISEGFEFIKLHTQASTRESYLVNPPAGCFLNHSSSSTLKNIAMHSSIDIVLIVSDGLSCTAIEDHAFNLLKIFISQIIKTNLTISPVIAVPFGRVAVSDHIGEILNAKIAIVLIGERPGLSAHNSMGIYTTFYPKLGCTNADRKCISNIRPPYGLSYTEAVEYILNQVSNFNKSKLEPKEGSS